MRFPHIARSRVRPALVVLVAGAACTDLFGGGPEIGVSLDTSSRSSASATPLTLDVDGNGLRVRLTEDRSSRRVEVNVRGDRYGDRAMRVTLRSPEGDSLAGVAFDQHFGRDDNHWIGAVVGTRRPFSVCGQPIATPVAGRADTLFVFYGGLSKDAIC